jgi:hypothetical protein
MHARSGPAREVFALWASSLVCERSAPLRVCAAPLTLVAPRRKTPAAQRRTLDQSVPSFGRVFRRTHDLLGERGRSPYEDEDNALRRHYERVPIIPRGLPGSGTRLRFSGLWSSEERDGVGYLIGWEACAAPLALAAPTRQTPAVQRRIPDRSLLPLPAGGSGLVHSSQCPAGVDRGSSNGIPRRPEPGDAESMSGIPTKTIPRPS